MTEIPGLTADVLRRSAEDGALDGHPTVRRIVVPRRQETLDRQAEEDDPSALAVEVPARNMVGRLDGWDRTDLEPDLLQFGPRAAEELDGGSDGQIESVDASIERSERRPHDLTATQSAVPSVAGPAPRGCSTASGAATRHDESLGGAGARGAASAPPRPLAVLLR